MKYWLEVLYLLCMWLAQCYAVGETKPTNADLSGEIYSCDYTRFEAQLERMNLQAKINHEEQLNQQKELFNKINDLSLQIKGIEAKLLEKPDADRHVALVPPPPLDNKMAVLNEIREKLKEHDNMLAGILNKQNNTEELCKNINLKDHSEALKPTLSEHFLLMQKIDEKLTHIGSNSVSKNEQLKFYQDIQQHLNATEKFLKNDTCSLISLNSSQSYPTSCSDFNANYCPINKCLIKNQLYGPAPFFIACNNSVDGGGWTVIQRRIDGSADFYRDWSEYKSGFGNLDGEFFIGLDKLHALTATLKPVELLIQLQDFDNILKYAKYDNFEVANENENYKLLSVGSYSGDAGDSFSQHVGYNFSTKDPDNDIANGHCAEGYTSAWWFYDCYRSNLNGKYYQHPTKYYNASLENVGINWNSFHGYKYSLKSVQMLIRPRNNKRNKI